MILSLSTNATFHCLIKNQGSESVQIGSNIGGTFATNLSALVTGTINTQNPQDLVITMQKTVAGDTAVLESYIVEIL